MIVNRTEITKLLGKSPGTIDSFVKDEGMPGKKNAANAWEFDVAQCIAWLVAREVGRAAGSDKEMRLVELRERSAKAGIAEYNLAVKQKEFIRLEDASIINEAQMSVVKSRSLALPGRMAQRLAAESDPAVVLQLLKDEVADMLEYISSPAQDITEADLPDYLGDDEETPE